MEWIKLRKIGPNLYEPFEYVEPKLPFVGTKRIMLYVTIDRYEFVEEKNARIDQNGDLYLTEEEVF